MPMLISKVAKRYAKGIFDFAQESGKIDLLFGEMKDLLATLNNSPELRRTFTSPIIDYRKKEAISNQLFSGFSADFRNVMTLIIRQKRERHLEGIAEAYVEMVEQMRGVQRISLVSATPLSQQNIDEILKSSSLVDHSKSFEIDSTVKPEILGGYILRVGDQQMDASVRSKLNNIKKEFQLN